MSSHSGEWFTVEKASRKPDVIFSGYRFNAAQLKVGLCYEYGDAYPGLLILNVPFWDPVTETFDFILKKFNF